MHLCNGKRLDNIVEDNNFASYILFVLILFIQTDDDSMDVKMGKHLIQLVNKINMKKIRSIHDEELSRICVDFFINEVQIVK